MKYPARTNPTIMKSFLKIFLGCFVALVIFTGIMFFAGVGIFKTATKDTAPEIKPNSVLVLDLSLPVAEQRMDGGFNLPNGQTPAINGLFDIVRAILQAKTDSSIKGIYIKSGNNNMGYAASDEVRAALLNFKSSGKFIIAYADWITQRAYYVASVAGKVYCHPKGNIDWKGFSMEISFLKGALDKLEIEPEIFYAGQFKSATEPFRLTRMSDANRQQMTLFMNDMYSNLLLAAKTKSSIDTGILHRLANLYSIKIGDSALAYQLVDGLKYDDEVKEELQNLLHIGKADKINFVAMGDYIKNARWNKPEATDKIALIYAEGEIVTGNGEDGQIGAEKYKNLLRKVRLDNTVKAVVFRVNSPGGSSLASEIIWRELELIKKEKPLVVSMGDYAASGGYYISCMADSIFAQPNTLTGSIGVFGMYFNAQKLFNNKLGITFDGVKTSPYADYGTTNRPMTEFERNMTQEDINLIYSDFTGRVADGRKLNKSYVDSIGQGHIWCGTRGVALKLVDKIGGLQDALDCAARMAKLKSYELREFPVVQSFWEKVMSGKSDNKNMAAGVLKEEMGEAEYELLQQVKEVKTWCGSPQTRMPFTLRFN